MNLPWEEVKERADIVEVISNYVPLKAKGGNFTCNCPFHNEKTPSLIISPSKQIWHCFGCGAGGDIFGFVSLIENIEKVDALKKLAKQYSVTIPNLISENRQSSPQDLLAKEQKESEFQKGQKMLAWSAEVYNKVLLKLLQDKDHPVVKYCVQRGLTPEIIKEFQIGYAPKNKWLLSLLQKYNLDQSLALKIGLLKDLDK